MAKDNRTLGRFHLDGIPPAPRGTAQIEVAFDIDADGILNVSATEKNTGKEQKIRIEASSGLTEEEIEKMKADAKANEEKDKAERETVDKVNAADSMIFQTEKQLKEYGDKLSEDNKTKVESALAELKKAHEAKDMAAIDTTLNNLNTVWQAASQEMYQATQSDQANASSEGEDGKNADGKGSDSGVTDVEYEEVEDNKDKDKK